MRCCGQIAAICKAFPYFQIACGNCLAIYSVCASGDALKLKTQMIKKLRTLFAMAFAIIAITNSGGAEETAPATPSAPPPNPWKSSASLGLTLTRGNSDTLLAAFAAKTEKSWDRNELSFGADATYGESKINGQE